MSEQSYGEASVEQAAGFVPLEDPNRPDEAQTYEGDNAARDAADDLAKSRSENRVRATERKYFQYGGENDGQETDSNRTITIDRAARDLTNIRAEESADQEAVENQAVSEYTDQVRSALLGPEYPAQTGEHSPAIEPQPETEHAQPGVDPEIAQALQNPKIRQALEAEVASAESYRQHYAQATTQAAQIAAAALYSSFPEIGGLTPEQLPGALQVLAHQNPARYNQIRGHIDKTFSLYGASLKAQEAQQQIAATQFRQFAEQQDAVFENSLKSEPPAQVQKVKAEVFEIAERDYGVSRAELSHLYQTQPIMRTAAFQRMMFDAARYQLAARGAREAAPPNLPPVHRPGVARDAPSHDDAAIDRATRAFRADPTPKTAAALLRAKRASTE